MPWHTIFWASQARYGRRYHEHRPSHQSHCTERRLHEARLLRAEALIKMQQYKEATEDIDAILSQDPDEEAALLLRGKVKEAAGQQERSHDYRYNRIESFNEQAFLCLGQLYIVQKKYPEAISPLTKPSN